MKNYFTKSVKPPITDTHELLREIEKKDAAFRVTQFVFFIMALAFLGALLLSNYRLQNENTGLLKAQNQTLMQTKATTDQLKANDKHNAQALQDLQNHIDCIVNLFTQPNRSNLTIVNIQTCQLAASATT